LLFNFFFGVEGCVVDHPRITIIKEEEEDGFCMALSRPAQLQIYNTNLLLLITLQQIL